MNTNTINSKNVISGVNDLATKCPKISAMWSSKNTYTPSEVSVGSNKKAWFVCPDCKQEFEARVFHVARSLMRGNTGCPVCAGIKVVPGINDLATKCPKIFAMWSAKNTYTPSEVSAGSNKKVWFVCPDCKQEFEASICNVVHTVQNGSTGCPVCAGRKVVSGINDLATKFPMAASMWSDKNDCSPSEVSAGNNKKAWFVCPECRMRMRTISAARKDEHDFEKSVGTTMTMKNGSKATCIAYHGVNNITVKFEDGFVLYHARWNQFVRGALHHNQKNINE